MSDPLMNMPILPFAEASMRATELPLPVSSIAPPVERMPSVAIASLTVTGRPWSGPSKRPSLRAASASRARSSAEATRPSPRRNTCRSGQNLILVADGDQS